MSLSKEERKLLHQKSQQPTFGRGKPDGLQGHDGDISYRDIEGSGTVSYLKKGNDWLAISASGEMPPVRIIGNNSRSGVTSEHIHGMYINKNGSVAYTGDQSFGSHNITDVADLTVIGNASVGGDFTVTGNRSSQTNATFYINENFSIEAALDEEGEPGTGGGVEISSQNLISYPTITHWGGLGDQPIGPGNLYSHRQDISSKIFQWSFREHLIESGYEFKLHANAANYLFGDNNSINPSGYNMYFLSGTIDPNPEYGRNGRIKFESCESGLFEYDNDDSYPGISILAHSPAADVRQHMNKILIHQKGVRTPELFSGSKGSYVPGFYDFEGIQIIGDGGVRIMSPLTSWDDASNVVVSPCIRIQSSKHVEISGHVHGGNMPTIELQIGTPDRTKIWNIFEFSSLYKPHRYGRVYTDTGKLEGTPGIPPPGDVFTGTGDDAQFHPPEWNQDNFGPENHEFPRIEGLHIGKLGKASTHSTRHPEANGTDSGTDGDGNSISKVMGDITNNKFLVLGDLYEENSDSAAGIRTLDLAPGTVWEVRVMITYIHSDVPSFFGNVAYEYGLQIGYVFFANALADGSKTGWSGGSPGAAQGLLDPEDTGVGYQLNYYSGYSANSNVDMGNIIFDPGYSGNINEDDGIKWECKIDDHDPAGVSGANTYVHKRLLVYTSVLRLMSGVDFVRGSSEEFPTSY